MKKLITKLMTVTMLLLLSVLNLSAQTWLCSSTTYNSVSKGYELTGAGTYFKSTSGGTTTSINTGLSDCHGSTSNIVMSSNLFVFLTPVDISGIVIYGNSGTGSTRSLSSVSTSSTLGGTYTALSPAATATGTLSGKQSTNVCAPDPLVITFGSIITAGKYLTITLNGNAYVAAIDLTPACSAPSIGTQPATAGQSLSQGATPTALTVAATGTGLSYQWYSNKTSSNTGGTSLAPVGQASSFTPPTTSLGITYYYCVVTGTCGSVTSNVSGAITVTAPVPTISLTSGSNPVLATLNVAITPVVYNYVNVANDNDITAVWYTDNTYTTITTAPAGLSMNQNTTTKTMTLSGTPLSIGTFYYVVAVNETSGNSINGSIVVSPPPAPIIAGGTNTNTNIKPGVAAITNIVYTLTNSAGASVSGLPTGLSGNYSAGTYTISGTVDASVTSGLYPFTVTATALAGYSGTAITATGTIVVKSLTANQILYLAGAAAPDAKDTRLYPMLNNSTNYIVTVKQAASTAPATSTYSIYDAIILNEIVGSANLEAQALKSIDKPILNLKSFMYSASPKWGWGSTPDFGKANNGTVTVNQPSHPIFNGLSVGSTLDLLSGAATKGILPTDVTLLGSICVATAPLNASPYNPAIAIHDVPASVRATNTSSTITSKYVMVSISNDSYDKMTDAALTLINNTLDYLINGTQFVAPSLQISSFNVSSVNATIDQTAKTISATLPIGTDLTALKPAITLAGVGTAVSPATIIATDFSNSLSTPVSYTVSDGINSKIYAVTIMDATTGLTQTKLAGVTFDGQIIHNNANLDLQVYDVTGRKVATSNKYINMSSNPKGIYIVKSINGTLKITLVK